MTPHGSCSVPLVEAKAHLLLRLIELAGLLRRGDFPDHLLEQLHNLLLVIVKLFAEFAPVPGMGSMFVADPDGNWVELVGPL